MEHIPRGLTLHKFLRRELDEPVGFLYKKPPPRPLGIADEISNLWTSAGRLNAG